MSRPLHIVHVISTSYSGSTWLNLMLGSHSQAFCVGEIKNMYKLGKPVCQLHGEACPVWSRYTHAEGQASLQQVAELTDSSVLIVNNSAKSLSAIALQDVRSSFIHLVRDGRAVTASYLRKNPGRSVWWAARSWRRSLQRNLELLKAVPESRKTTVVYETLQTDTERQMQRICAFLDLPFEPDTLRYWGRDHCYLGGNRGTLFAMQHKRGRELPDDPRHQVGRSFDNWDPAHYQKTDPARFVDERWKHELGDWQLRLFAVAAGSLNHRLGYSRSLDRDTPPAPSSAGAQVAATPASELQSQQA